jgi:hypothetical protein
MWHRRQDERQYQDGQLDTQVLQSILEISGVKQSDDMHQVEQNEQDSSFVMDETAPFFLEVLPNYSIHHPHDN